MADEPAGFYTVGWADDYPGPICRDFIPKDGGENTESDPLRVTGSFVSTGLASNCKWLSTAEE